MLLVLYLEWFNILVVLLDRTFDFLKIFQILIVYYSEPKEVDVWLFTLDETFGVAVGDWFLPSSSSIL